MPASIAFLIEGDERLGVRDRDDEARRLLGHGGVDQLRHLDHVALGVRGAVVDGDAHVRGAGLDAVAHDAPEAVDRLAVGHDLDLDVAASGRAHRRARRRRRHCRDGVAALQAPSTTIAPTSRTTVLRRFILCLSSRIDRAPARPTSVADRPRPSRRQVPLDPSGRTRDPDPVARPCHLLSSRTAAAPPVSLGSPRVAPVGARGASGSPPLRCAARRHRRGPCTGSGTSPRATRMNVDEFGGVRRREPVDEVGPRRTGRRRHARLDRAESASAGPSRRETLSPEPNSSARMS